MELDRPPRRLSSQELLELTGWQPDGQREDHWVGVTNTVHNARDLRALLVNMAYAAEADPVSTVLFIILKSQMSEARIDQELRKFVALLKVETGRALSVLSYTDESCIKYGTRLPVGPFRAWLQALVNRRLAFSGASSSRESVFGMVALLFLKGVRTTSARQIQDWTGASHPTVAGVLRELVTSTAIHREYGKVTLQKFPLSAWEHWIARQADATKHVCFVNQWSGRQSISALIRRVRALNRSDIAISGLHCAKRSLSGLEFPESTCLQLTIHGSPQTDLSFISRLDEGLTKSDSFQSDACLNVNFVSRSASFFEVDSSGDLWSDSVTCMINLHSTGYKSEADGLLQHLLALTEKQNPLF